LGFKFWIGYISSEDNAAKGGRYIYALLGLGDFSLGNVTKLVSDLAKRYGRPKLLSITVFSDETMLKRGIATLSPVTTHFQGLPNEEQLSRMESSYPATTGYYRARFFRSADGRQRLFFSPDPDRADKIEIELPDSGPYISSGDFDILVAAARGDIGKICTLISAGVGVNTKDQYGRTALARAALAGQIAAVDVLLALGADVDTLDRNGLTPLMMGVLSREKAIVDLLLAKGARINSVDNYGKTALLFSAESAEICELLLASGADVNLKDNDGQTALMIAAKKGKLEVVRILLARGADFNLRNRSGETALMLAHKNHRVEVVDHLKAMGAR
jgi:hypothetical protein